MNVASQKYADFELEDAFFQKKYGMPFVDFEARIRSSDEEHFEMEDDYHAWKFAYDGVKYLQSHIEPQTLSQKSNP